MQRRKALGLPLEGGDPDLEGLPSDRQLGEGHADGEEEPPELQTARLRLAEFAAAKRAQQAQQEGLEEGQLPGAPWRLQHRAYWLLTWQARQHVRHGLKRCDSGGCCLSPDMHPAPATLSDLPCCSISRGGRCASSYGGAPDTGGSTAGRGAAQ